ncbi:MAG TPA: acyl-CoA dehydrogenase family protein, partial [Pseudonocardia sp.]|nr:acyl-CoA dehydrogenase family protein [Pseudonocardia sp.]
MGLEEALGHLLEQFPRMVEGLDPVEQAVAADRAVQLYIDTTAARCLGYRGFAKLARGGSAPEQALMKVYASEARQRVALVAAEIHYATDAVGGFAVAVAVVLTVALVLDAAGGSRQRRSPAGITETVPRHGRRSGYPLNGTARRPGGAGTWRAR